MSKVYVLGSTGGVGTQVVQELLQKGISVTVLVRDPSKAASLFGECENLNVVQGDYTNFDSFKESIVGHERLFLLVNADVDMAKIKVTYAKIAYEAGVKQVVHISAGFVSGAWRQNYIGTVHYVAEEAIFNLPNRGAYVVLRPTAFFSNHLWADCKTIQYKSAIFGSAHPDEKRTWISTTDIAHLSANVLSEPIDRHGDIVYDMTSQMLSGNDRAAILSRVLGKNIKYIQISPEEEYKTYTEKVHIPHAIAYGVIDCSNLKMWDVNRGLPIVLHRPVETLDVWIQANIAKFTLVQ